MVLGPVQAPIDNSSVLLLAQIGATTCAGVFAGASVYVTLMQQPAMEASEDPLDHASLFRRMYNAAAPVQASLAISSSFSALSVCALTRGRGTGLWLWSGALMAAIIPYSIGLMGRLDKRLVDTEHCHDRGSDWMRKAIRKWGRLHNVRAYISMVAFTSMVVAVGSSAHGAHAQSASK